MEKHADKPFVLLGVNSDKDRQELKQVIKEEKLDWRSWWDGSTSGPIHEQWQISQRPAIFVIDQGGVIRFKSNSNEGLDEAIESLLQQGSTDR